MLSIIITLERKRVQRKMLLLGMMLLL